MPARALLKRTLSIFFTAGLLTAFTSSARAEWQDFTALDGLTSALNQSMGNVLAEDFNRDGTPDLLFISSDREPRLFLRNPAARNFQLLTKKYLSEAAGTTHTFRLGLTHDIDADGKPDLLFFSYFTFNPVPPALRPPGVQLYLSSGAGLPANGQLWRTPTDEAHLDRLLSTYFASRQGFEGRAATPEELELNSEAEPANDPVAGQNPLVRHSAPFGHSDKGAWLDFDGDGVKELLLVRKEMRALIYAAPSFDARIVQVNPETRTLTLLQSEASATERDLGDRLNPNGTIARGEYRKFKIKARTVDFPIGSEVRIRNGAQVARGVVQSVSSQEAGVLGLSKGRVRLEVRFGRSEALFPAGNFRVNRLKRYTQVYAFGEEETLASGNIGANRRQMSAQRAVIQVVDLNQDGRQEAVIVDQSSICDPQRESEGNLVSIANAFGCYGSQSDGNARVHVIGYQSSGDGQGRIVDWMNLPVPAGQLPSFEPSDAIPTPSSQAGTGVAFSDLNGDGVLDLIVSGGARSAGERRCLLFLNARRNLNVNEPFEEEVRWGCPFIAAQGRIDSPDRSLNVAGLAPPKLPDVFRTRVFYGIRDGSRIRFRAGPIGLAGTAGPYENFERIFSVGDSSTAGGSDRAGHRVVLLRAPGSGPLLPAFDVGRISRATGGRLQILKGCRNSSNFQFPQLVSDVAVRDMNNDGNLDLIFYAPTQDFIFYGDESGCFNPALQAPITTRWFNRMAKADFNGDGAEDLALTVAGDTALDFAAGMGPRLLFGSPSGLVDRTHLLPALPPVDSLIATDLNGDQIPDLLVTGRMIRPTLLLGNGSGFIDVSDACLPAALRSCTPAAAPGLRTDCTAYSIATPDLNGDGKPDLVLTSSKGVNRILFNLMRSHTLPAEACVGGPLRLAPDPSLPGIVPLLDSGTNQPAAWAPPRYLDAAEDLAAPDRNRILRMDIGTNRIKYVTSGDFNGDGRPDLFMASGAYSLAERQSVGHALFLNRMVPGSLPRLREPSTQWIQQAPDAIPADLRSDSGTTCVRSADLNGDGVSDLLIVRSGNPNPVSWLERGASDEDLENAETNLLRSSLADEQPRRLNAAGTGLDYPVRFKVRILLGSRTADPSQALLLEEQNQAIAAVEARYPGTRTFDCRIQDVNSDGRPDLILGGYTFGNETYAPSSHRNSGDGWSHTYWMNEAKGIQVFQSRLIDGRLDFISEAVTPIRVKNYSIEVLNWSGTGRLDIYVGNASQSRLLMRSVPQP